jgi:hypothetical protein
MTTDEKLAAILAAVQTDPGNRGLARDPADNLFTATAGDFAAACRSLAEHPRPLAHIVTGFHVPTPAGPLPETDGPLGAVFLVRALTPLGIACAVVSEPGLQPAILHGLKAAGQQPHFISARGDRGAAQLGHSTVSLSSHTGEVHFCTHQIALERVGPATDGRCYSMRGIDITDATAPLDHLFTAPEWRCTGPAEHRKTRTIGIGDGGNEIGMGRILHDTIVKNIPDGETIHCRVPTDFLVVSGVSNWGAYALAAGVTVLREAKPAADLFDPAREREILEVMVREGGLVDGVNLSFSTTVDGLSWDEYAKPLARIREILES